MKFLKDADCSAKTTLSRTQLYRLTKAGQFPEKIEISPGRTAWIESEVEDWMRARIAASRGGERGEA